MSTPNQVGCPAEEKLASLQQAPPKLHVETWAGLLQGPDPRISLEVEIAPGCAVTVACLSCTFNSPVSPGPGRVIRNMLGWSLEEKQLGRGMVVPWCPETENLFSPLSALGDWVKRDHTAWAVP